MESSENELATLEERFCFFASPAYLSMNKHHSHRFTSRGGGYSLVQMDQAHDVGVDSSPFFHLALSESRHIVFANQVLTSYTLSLRNQYSWSRGTKEPPISAIARRPPEMSEARGSVIHHFYVLMVRAVVLLLYQGPQQRSS